jgi:hypothetical protein
MENIRKQYKRLSCSVLNREVEVEFHSVVVENEIISPPHMRGCDSIDECNVKKVQQGGAITFEWNNCPIS